MQLGAGTAAGWQGEAGVGVDDANYRRGSSFGQGGYGEQPYGTASSYEGAGYGVAGVKDRPSPTGSEPPCKKLRNVDNYRGETAGGGHESGFGYSGAPPESGHGGSALGSAPVGPPGMSGVEGYGIAGTQSYGISGSQNFVASDVQGYGSYGGLGFEQQQYPACGSSAGGGEILNYGTAQQMPQSFQRTPQETAPVGSVSGPAAGRGRGLMNLLYKTKLCANFKRGMCTFNENCCFAHGVGDLRKRPPGWEQMLNFVGGAAPGGRGAGPNFFPGEGGQKFTTKARLCKYFAEGNCPYGIRCNFLHGLQKYGGCPDGTPSDMLPASVAYGTEQDLLDANKEGDQTYSRRDDKPGVNLHSELQSQQQHNALFFQGGSAYDYAGPKQDANSSYGQVVSSNEVGYAQRSCSSNLSHSGQQADYTCR